MRMLPKLLRRVSRIRRGPEAILFQILMALVFATPSSAGFFEDLFGGSDPAPHATPAKIRQRASGRTASVRSHRERVSTEIHFMPLERDDARRSVRALQDRHNAKIVEERRRVSLIVASADATHFSSGSKPLQASLCKPMGSDSSSTPADLLLYDKTLRSGDILVTEKGVQVFRGQKACPHNAQSFIALSNAGVSKSRRNTLLAIQEAMHGPNGYLVTAEHEKY